MNYCLQDGGQLKMPRKKKVEKEIFCPKCKSADITLYMGGIFGKYKCKSCGYIGPIVVEKELD